MKRVLCVVCVMVALTSVAVAQERPVRPERPQPTREAANREAATRERPNAVNAERVEGQIREFNTRIERLSGALAKAREAGNEDEVRELSQMLQRTERERNALRERLQNAARPQPTREAENRELPQQQRPNAVNAERVEARLRELNARMERLGGALEKAREAGNEDEVRKLSQMREETERERNAFRERLQNAARPQPTREAANRERPQQERPNAVNAERVEARLRELNARMERLGGALEKAREAGNEDEVRKLSQMREETERERNAFRERLQNAEK